MVAAGRSAKGDRGLYDDEFMQSWTVEARRIAILVVVGFELSVGTVDVWEARLQDVTVAELQHFEGLLSPTERDRASRFHFDRDRERFIVGRGRLRQLLGLYADEQPDTIRIETRASGKPFTPDEEL